MGSKANPTVIGAFVVGVLDAAANIAATSNIALDPADDQTVVRRY